MESGVFLFPFAKVPCGSSVVIYGAGTVAYDFVKIVQESNYCHISFAVGNDYLKKNKLTSLGIEVLSPDVLKERKDFDYVVIASGEEKFRKEIFDFLCSICIEKNKIIDTDPPVYKCRSVTYSQHGEDLIILNAFKHMGFFRDGKLPSYIDVGAHHPYEISNTALFHSMGCKGINIEANPVLIENFNKERPDDINLCVGIGPKEGTFPFYISKYAGLNTFKKENLQYNEFLVKHDTGKQEKFDVESVIDLPVKRLDVIVNEYCDGIWPDFMSIDIEGMEFESLKDCDLSKGPKLIAIEVNYDGDLFIKMFEEKGYFPYLWYRENILFVRNDYKSLVYAHTER